jgi:zinc/manganese transport system ATP-binding protein
VIAPRPAPAAPTPGTAGPLVRLRAVDAGYGERLALADVSIDVGSATLLGIVGPSGAGKTTLLHTLTGSVVPRAGSVERRPGLRVGYVPQVQTVDWSFPITVAECVLLARTARRWWPRTTADDRRDGEDMLERLGLGGLGARHIRELSGGQQQRVFLARALLQRPDLVVLDEPTSGVDLATRHEVLHLLRDLNADGLAIVLSTHDLNGVAAHLPEIAFLNQRIVAAGAPMEVVTPAVLEATYGAPLEVLVHAGLPVVVDQPSLSLAPRPDRRAS